MSMSLDNRGDGKLGRIEANTDSDWANCAEYGETGNWCEPWEVVHHSGKKRLDAANDVPTEEEDLQAIKDISNEVK